MIIIFSLFIKRRTVTDTVCGVISEKTAFVEVDESMCLLQECRWEAVCVSLIVDVVVFHEVVHLKEEKEIIVNTLRTQIFISVRDSRSTT